MQAEVAVQAEEVHQVLSFISILINTQTMRNENRYVISILGRGSSSRSSYSTSHTSHSSSSHSSYTPTSHSTSHSTYSRPDKSGSSSLIFGERHQSSGNLFIAKNMLRKT